MMAHNASVTSRTSRARSPHKRLGFYTSAQASRIACVPEWTMGNWRRNGIIIPTVKWIDEKGKEHPGHTFDTVVFMRLLRLLRERGITLYKAVDAMQQLKKRFGPPSSHWADAKIFVDNKDAYVYMDEDKDRWDVTVATRYNQKVAHFIFGEEFALLKQRADALLIPSQFMDYVEIDPAIQNGLPIVLETKILTSTIHDLNSQGYQAKDIHNMYPFIPETRIVGAEEYETFLDKSCFN